MQEMEENVNVQDTNSVENDQYLATAQRIRNNIANSL